MDSDSVFSAFSSNSNNLGILITIIGIIVTLVSIILTIHLIKNKKAKKYNTIFTELNSFHNYANEEIYIPIDCKDPQSDNPNKRVSFFSLFIKIIKRKQIDTKYICILGGIGAGKTDALVHLYINYVKKYDNKPQMPSNIKLYTMNIGYENLKKRLDVEIPDKRGGTILLLDALDECMEARKYLVNASDNNPGTFMNKVAEDTKDFAWIVISCRKQFFQKEEYKPDKTGIKIDNKFPDPIQKWHYIYIEPFNNWQVRRYLNKRFKIKIFNNERMEARRLVLKCKDTFLRPLIMSHIDILLEEYKKRNEPLTTKEIYDTIIMFWIKRESECDVSKTKKLLNASICMAAYMNNNNLSYLDDNEYECMCKMYQIEDNDNLLRVKSLLKKSEIGYSFSHQSFYEHLLSYWFYLNPGDINPSLKFFDSTIKTYMEILYSSLFNKGITEMSKTLNIEKVLWQRVAVGLKNWGIVLNYSRHYYEANLLFDISMSVFGEPDDSVKKILMDEGDRFTTLGTNKSEMSLRKIAKDKCLKTIGYIRKVNDKNPDAYLHALSRNLYELANIYLLEGKRKEAENTAVECLQKYRKLSELKKNEKVYYDMYSWDQKKYEDIYREEIISVQNLLHRIRS